MSRPRNILRLIAGNFVFLLNILAVLWLVACSIAQYYNPVRAKLLAPITLTTSIAILVNLFFVILWLFRRHKWRTLLSVVALVGCQQTVRQVTGLHFFAVNDMSPGAHRLKVMTWNVHGLGIYDKPYDKTTPDKMVSIIKQENPDVLCMIEYYTDYTSAYTPYTNRILQECGYLEYRFVYDNTLGTKIFVGIALFSKYPLSGVDEVTLAGKIKMMQADIALGNGKTVRAYLMHLQSFMLMDKDKQFIEVREQDSRRVGDSLLYSRTLAGKIVRAYERRSYQADSAAALIARSPYPTIVCADLNDLPASYAYRKVRGSMMDVFVEKGRGFGRTYNELFPTLRIDYIFYDPHALSLLGYRRIPTSLSDHNPVIANFSY